MNKAYQVVLSDSNTIHELTSLFGYNDSETFSRVFKKYNALASDAFKAIVKKIQSKMNNVSDSLILKTYEVEEASEIKGFLDRLAKELPQKLIERSLNEEDVRNSKLMTVQPKTGDMKEGSKVVKNKFMISENPIIWKNS